MSTLDFSLKQTLARELWKVENCGRQVLVPVMSHDYLLWYRVTECDRFSLVGLRSYHMLPLEYSWVFQRRLEDSGAESVRLRVLTSGGPWDPQYAAGSHHSCICDIPGRWISRDMGRCDIWQWQLYGPKLITCSTRRTGSSSKFKCGRMPAFSCLSSSRKSCRLTIPAWRSSRAGRCEIWRGHVAHSPPYCQIDQWHGARHILVTPPKSPWKPCSIWVSSKSLTVFLNEQSPKG